MYYIYIYLTKQLAVTYSTQLCFISICKGGGAQFLQINVVYLSADQNMITGNDERILSEK
jgi:hypothetical protein